MKGVVVAAAIAALCPGKIPLRGPDIMSDFKGPHIFISAEFRRYPRDMQSFIYLHECGHTHGIWSETGADAYALSRMRVSPSLADRLCRNLKGDDYYTARCKQIKGAAKRE